MRILKPSGIALSCLNSHIHLYLDLNLHVTKVRMLQHRINTIVLSYVVSVTEWTMKCKSEDPKGLGYLSCCPVVAASLVRQISAS